LEYADKDSTKVEEKEKEVNGRLSIYQTVTFHVSIVLDINTDTCHVFR
jgi:hypothetical protein